MTHLSINEAFTPSTKRIASRIAILLVCAMTYANAIAQTTLLAGKADELPAPSVVNEAVEDVPNPWDRVKIIKKKKAAAKKKKRKKATTLVMPEDFELKFIDSLSIVNADTARLIFPAGHKRIMPLYAKLSRLFQGQNERISFLHLGDSHIQADVVSGRMRQNLSSMAGSSYADRGLLFPFGAIGTNAPWDYKITSTGRWDKTRNIERSPSRPMGIAGAVAATSDPSASLTINVKDERWAFDTLHILGETTAGAKTPLVVLDGQAYSPIAVPASVASASADSIDAEISHTGFVFQLPRETTTCQVVFEGSGTFDLRGLVPTSPHPGIIYSATGINGATCTSWNRCQKFAEELPTICPDVLVAALGTNDANGRADSFNPEVFKANYRKLLDKILEVNPDCFIIFVTNNDCYIGGSRTWCPTTPASAQAIRELAAEYHGCYFDVFEIMGGSHGTDRWVSAGLQNTDHVHFTAKGYNLLGDLLFNALMIDYEDTAQ